MLGDWVECHGKGLRLSFFGEIVMMTNDYGVLLRSKNFAIIDLFKLHNSPMELDIIIPIL